MAVIIRTSNPRHVLNLFKSNVANRDITTWLVDVDGDFTIANPKWTYMAWMRPMILEGDDRLVFGFVSSRKELPTMRLDKYLKVSRVIKRRTLANEVADAGRVLVNGKPAKASYTVKVGDIIEVTFGNRPVKIRVLSDVEQKGKDVAREMFEIIED